MRRQKLGPIALALLAGFAGGTLSNLVWNQSTVLAQGPMRAQEFQLVDPKGQVIGEWKSGAWGGEFTLFDRGGGTTWHAPQPLLRPLTQGATP